MAQGTTDERWLPIPGYEDLYEISDQGRVRAWKPHRGLPVPRILKLSPDAKGYLRVSLCRDGHEQTVRTYKLVMLAFVGPRPDGMEVRHLDGDQLNNNLGNLAYGTHSENVRDSIRHGTQTNARETHCPKGHAYSPENTYVDKKGIRHCRACKREVDRRRVRSAKAQAQPEL